MLNRFFAGLGGTSKSRKSFCLLSFLGSLSFSVQLLSPLITFGFVLGLFVELEVKNFSNSSVLLFCKFKNPVFEKLMFFET